MTGGIGVLVEDAGYCSEANLTAEGSVDKLIATGNRASMGKAARDNPAAGPPPENATATGKMDHRLRTPKAAPPISAARPMSKDCTPASRTSSGCAASPCAA